MNSEQIFSLALGLNSPFFVSKIEFQDLENHSVLHLYISYEQGFYKDEYGKSKVYDHEPRKWRHLNFFEHECYIHFNVPRILEDNNGIKSYRCINVPWARQGSGFTLMFEAFSMCLIEKEMPINKIGGLLKVYPNRIWTIFHYWINKAFQKATHSDINRIGIDETSRKKGHDYITVAVDIDANRTVFATEGKDASTINKIADYLESKGSLKTDIKQVSIDLSPAFISGVNSNFPNANITFDKFHVKSLLNKAMDEIRKNELKLHQVLKGTKYLFLKNENKLNRQQKNEREIIFELLPNIGNAYRLKLLFDDLWDFKVKDEAEGFLAYWCDLVKDSGIYPLIRFANTVKVHWSGIIHFIESKITNAILESINAKIQLAKKRARGYANNTNFINMIYS